jgi:hypothetical protein
MAEPATPPPGSGVDAHGSPVIDPTKNVLDLVRAGAESSDKILALHVKRLDDLRDMESKHVHELLANTSRYEDLLRQAETKRIDAIRTVDVNAVAEAARVSAAQALTLANQVATSAETLRTQVATVATATATALANALEPLQKAIEDLRKTQYEAQGLRTATVDQRADRGSERSANQWAIGIAIVIALAVMNAGLAYILKH